MSLTVDGVWKVGVWATTVWADGVWFEGSPTPPADIPIGGMGHPGGIYWGVRKHKKWTKNLDWLLNRVVSEYYGELTDEEMPTAVQKEAAKIVRPYAQDGLKVPERVDWSKLEADFDRVIMLLELYQRHKDIDDDDEIWMMMH